VLILSRRYGEGLKFFIAGREVLHLVIEKGSGNRLKVLMQAPDDVLIEREENVSPQESESCKSPTS
jgi:sRNA-binding carbon storage regulator CsrA